MDWDDHRYVLAIVEAGSLSEAARTLQVTHPTVARRIARIEAELHTAVVTRTPDGYRPTPAGRFIAERARHMAASIAEIEAEIAGGNDRPSGRLAITTTEFLGAYCLVPYVAGFIEAYPHIDVDLNLTYRPVDLQRRDTDIAVRMGAPVHEDLVGRRIGAIGYGLYCSRAYIEAHGAPERPKDLARHRIIGSLDDAARFAQSRRLDEMANGAERAFVSDSVLNQLAAARAGMGIMTLSAYMAATAPELVRVLAGDFDLAIDVWILTHRGIRDFGRVRAGLDYFGDAVGAHLARGRPL